MFFDRAVPRRQHVAEAYELINYLYRPDVAAKNSDFLSYANGNHEQKLVDPQNPGRPEYLSRRGDTRKAVRDHRTRPRHPAHHQPALDQGEDGAVKTVIPGRCEASNYGAQLRT